eukprot:GEMP01067800.1.p1 GENE.GEMP01067800.1~~GEMP01067800.1.p1  ORF type:complete len:241 (+),score=78.75 GEMP01067800.1:55-777(+)
MVWYFATVVVYVESDYLFEALYCKDGKKRRTKSLGGEKIQQDVESITLAEVLAKETPGLRSLIDLLRPPAGTTMDTCDGYFGPDGFSSKCAQALVTNFSHAWLMILLDRLLKERPIDADVVTRDIDALHVFANELTNTVPQLGEGVRAVQTALAQGWSPAQLRVWATHVIKKKDDKKKNKKKKKTLLSCAGLSSPSSAQSSVGSRSPVNSSGSSAKKSIRKKSEGLFTRLKNKMAGKDKE